MIKFVYFDVGGVVILDFSGTTNWAELKQELGVTLERNAEFEELWKKYEPQVCVGKDAESLLPLFKKQFNSKLANGYSLLVDGFVNRFQVNRSIWPTIEKIHQKCKVGLLTNQYPRMFEAIHKQGIMPKVNWDVVIDSSVEQLAKPNPAIFKLAEEKAGVKPSEIFFVENSLKHIDAAEKLGWQTFLYDSSNYEKSSKELLEVFNRLIIINK